MSYSARRYRILHPPKFVIAHDRSSIYASAPFKFIIDGNPLYIHAELVSRHSKPLDRMINGYMSEAQKGFAVIKDVDEGTFVRFIQWAYNGYYEAGEFKIDSPRADSASLEEQVGEEPYPEEPASAPAPVSYLEEPYPEEPASAPAPESYLEEPAPEESAEAAPVEAAISDQFGISKGGWRRSSSRNRFLKKGRKGVEVVHIRPGALPTSRQGLKELFIGRRPTVSREAVSICPPRPNQAPNEDYTEVFLSHARVYVFAEEYDIQSLKALALDELHGTLQNFDLHAERTGDIIALLRYVYTNTGESADEVEDMRTVLKHYVGFEMDILMKDNDFGDLMIEDGGALLRDFMKMVEQRI